MKMPQIVKTLPLLFSFLFLASQFARADIRGPYTPDANTLFLLHFDEPSGSSAAANSGSKGGNFYTVLNDTTGNGLANPPAGTSLLGNSSFPGFGNAVTATNTDGTPSGVIGYDGNNSDAYEADVQGGPASPDAIALTNLNMGNGGVTPFTLEALICPTVINVNQEIICTDDYNGQRGFQFKITSAGQLQFQMINGNNVNVTFSIPTSGPNAFAPNTWYHVALSYDGATARLYWTKLDAAIGAANLLGSSAWTCTTNTGAIVAPLDIGAENRGSAGESFRGLIDEVRISSVARAADEMQFFSSAVTISQQPVSQNIDDYQPVTFRVTAGSIFPIGYQWRFDGTPIPDATNANYSITSVNLTNAGNYDVVITNTTGNSATSDTATLTVGAANFLGHRWSFANDTSDSIGGATGINHGTGTVSDGALVLDGTADCYMELPPHLLSGLSAVTIDFWTTFGANADNCRVFDFGNTNFVNPSVPPPQNYVFFSPRAGGGNHVIGISGGSSEFQQTLAGAGILDGQTAHVTCVIDPPNNVMSIYTNGVLETSASLSVSLASLNDELCWIGRSLFDADPYLNASIDEFRIYGGALSANTVQQSEAAGPNSLLSDGPVQLVKEPVNAVAAADQSATFTGGAIGHQPITFQWYENGEAIIGATNNTYSLIATSDENNHTFQLRATNVVSGITYSAISSNATLTVRVPLNLTWAGAGSDWDTTSLNWTTDNNASQTHYTETDNTIFDNLGASQPNVNLTRDLHPASVTVNGSSSYTFSGVGSIAGSASLTKNGSGTLVVDTTNTYTGPTVIGGGTLQIGDGITSGTLGSGPVTNNTALVLRPGASSVIALSADISGAGYLTINGAADGSVILSGTNNYERGTTISSGSLHPRSSSALGSGSTIVNAGGQIYADVNVDLDSHPLTLNGFGISNDGALRKGGAGVTTFGGTVTLGSSTMLNVDGGATLNLTNSGGLSGISDGDLTLAGSGAGNITGPLSLGSGNLIVSGGTWTVAPDNNYSGLTTINGGALRITGARSVGPIPSSFNLSQITLNGGALEAATNITLNDGNVGITLNANSTITVDSNATFDISNPISGSGSLVLTKTGPGTLVLNGANSFGGTINLDSGSQSANDGKVVIADNAAIAGIPAIPTIPFLYFRNQNGGSSTLGLDGSSGAITVVPDISLNGRNVAVPAIENIAGDNVVSGNFTLGTGGGIYMFQSDSGTLTLTAPLPMTTPDSARTFTFSGAGTIVAAGGIQDASGAPISVIQNGTGTLILPAANTYSGATTISNGVLLLDGSIVASTNEVTVAGGLLTGNGSITVPVSVLPGGSIGAGPTNSTGTLNLSDTLTLGGNTFVKINKAASSSDRFTGFTSVTYGGTLTVTNLGGNLAINDTFTLFDSGASSGAFSRIIGSPGAGMSYSFANGVLTVVAGNSIADNATNITFSISGKTLTLSWPEDHLGWILQSQTNSLGMGLSTNWFDVPDSDSTTNTVRTIDSSAPAVFYRLRHP